MIKKITQNFKLIFLPCKENNFKARFLGSDFLFYLVLVFFILRIVILPFYIHFPKSIFFAKIISSDILELLNEERKSQGLTVLRENPELKEAAYLKAQDMLANDYFGHKSPTGISGWYWIQKSGYDYEIAGENLAIGFLDSKEVHQAWNNSPLHKNNLLGSYFQDIGIAVLSGEFQGKETTVVVQLFGKPGGKPVLREEIIPPAEAKAPEKEVVLPEKEKLPGREEKLVEEIPPEEKEEAIVEKAQAPVSEAAESLQIDFWEFLIIKYNDIARKVTFSVALLLTFVLILNLLSAIRLPLPPKPKLLLLREYVPGILALVSLILLGFLDKSIILQFIPHHLEI